MSYPELKRNALAAVHEPGAALANWLHRYTEFLATKRGLSTAYSQRMVTLLIDGLRYAAELQRSS